MIINKARSKSLSWKGIILASLVGGLLVASAAVGMHMTDQALFCGGCHSMNEAALTHKRSVHANLACNECHAPHLLTSKIPFKAKEGARDVWATVTSNVPDLIHPGSETKSVVQKNCIRCHSKTTSTVTMQSKNFCTDCHRHVPHSPKLPISKRSAADV